MQDLRLIERTLERHSDRRPARGRPARRATLLELVVAVQDFADSDDEVVRVITHMLRSGSVVLCGNFAGQQVEIGH